MEHNSRVIGDDTLTPKDKYWIEQDIISALSHTSAKMEYTVYWYLADILNRCYTKRDVYHFMPIQLHRYILTYISTPNADEVRKVFPPQTYHKTALEFINIRLTEMLLEE